MRCCRSCGRGRDARPGRPTALGLWARYGASSDQPEVSKRRHDGLALGSEGAVNREQAMCAVEIAAREFVQRREPRQNLG